MFSYLYPLSIVRVQQPFFAPTVIFHQKNQVLLQSLGFVQMTHLYRDLLLVLTVAQKPLESDLRLAVEMRFWLETSKG